MQPLTPSPARREPADFERELTAAALNGTGWDGLLAAVHGATGRHCRLVGPDGAVLAATDAGAGLAARRWPVGPGGTPVTAVDGWRARAIAAEAGRRTAGLLLIAEPAAPREVDLLRAAVTGVLIESVRREGHSAFPDAAALVAGLRSGAGSPPAALAAAATRFGLRIDRPGAGAVLSHVGSRHRAWVSALNWLGRPVERVGSLAYLLVSGDSDLDAVRARLELAVEPGAVIAACGALTADPAGYRASFAEADRLLAVARGRGRGVLSFDEAGVLQVLLTTPAPRLRWFVERHLGPILDRPEMLATLRAWLAAAGSRQAVSEALHLHRNSVGYRVGKLKTLLGVDPLRPECSAVLQAALAAHDLLQRQEEGGTTDNGHVKVAGNRR